MELTSPRRMRLYANGSLPDSTSGLPLEIDINLASRPAAQLFTEAMAAMRRVLKDDTLYLGMLRHVEGWIIGERSWLAAVAEQEAAGANPSEQLVSLPLVGASAEVQQP